MKIHTVTDADYAKARVSPWIYRCVPCGWLDGAAAMQQIKEAVTAGALAKPEFRRVEVEGAKEVPIQDAEALLIACDLGDQTGNGQQWKLNPLGLYELSTYYGIPAERVFIYDTRSGYEFDLSSIYKDRDGRDLREVREAFEKITIIRSHSAFDPVLKTRLVVWPIPVADPGFTEPGVNDISATDWVNNGLAVKARATLYEWASRKPTPPPDAGLQLIADLKAARRIDKVEEGGRTVLKPGETSAFDWKESLKRAQEAAVKWKDPESIRADHIARLSTDAAEPNQIMLKGWNGDRGPELVPFRQGPSVPTLGGLQYEHGEGLRFAAMRAAKTVLCVRTAMGEMPSSLFETMAAGRVPVLLGTENCPWPVTIGESDIDFCLRIRSNDAGEVGKLLNMYMRSNSDKIAAKCRRAREMWERNCSPAAFPRLLAATLKSHLS